MQAKMIENYSAHTASARKTYKHKHVYLHLQSFCQSSYGKLGRRVGCETEQPQLSCLRGHEHDSAHPPLLHGGDHCSAGVHAAQVVDAH